MQYEPIIQQLDINLPYELYVLRLDKVDENISGNKWFKLKYNLQKAAQLGHTTIITFGGAYSNHIAATAAAAKKVGIKAIGVIRGEEDANSNPTLKRASENGMQLHFISREFYNQKSEPVFSNYLNEHFGPHYLIPEGGNSIEGALGCAEILKSDWNHDYICCACGTGTTFAGLVASAAKEQKIIGISVLRGENTLHLEAMSLLKQMKAENSVVHGNEEIQKQIIEGHMITNNYCFSGYAKFDKELVDFKTDFESRYNIQLDHVYTSKLFYAVFDMIKKGKLKPRSKILVVHTGGLQGNKGFEERYQRMLAR